MSFCASDRMLTAKPCACRNTSTLAADLPMQTIRSGGSSDTEVKLFAVKPRGCPSIPAVVTMVTPVMKLPKAERSSRLSKRLRRSARRAESSALVSCQWVSGIMWRAPAMTALLPRMTAPAIASAMAGVEFGSPPPVAKSAGQRMAESLPEKARSEVAKMR